MTLLLDIIFIIFFIFLAGLFSAIEISIASFGSGKIEELKEHEHELVPAFERILENSNSFFGTIQILTTIFITCAILISFIASIKFLVPLIDDLRIGFISNNSLTISLIIAIIILTVLILVFSILIPKAIGFKYSDKIGRSSVKIFLLFISIFHYPVEFITRLGNLFLKPFKEKTNFSQTRLSEDEIRVIISDGVQSGAIDETEQEIIENIFEFNDLKANEVMIPRTEMTAVEIIDDNLQIAKEVTGTGYSLIPVYEESLDNIIGVLHTKDFIRSFLEQKPVNIKSLIRQAYFVPETKLISEILREMQKRGERMAIVTDEYGGTEGMITMDDILEEIVGEIKNETSTEERDYTKLPDGTFSVLGNMGIDDFNETFNLELPESEEYNTVAGFVADISGKILNRGEIAGYKDLKFELVKKIRQKMVQFKVYSDGQKFELGEEKGKK
ncbi:MAG TPA: hemolysin family protein [Ignavibacteriaceae bacterium]|nr:hemolysin family protein [Ignavibacteriaceae bacterium]